MRRFLIVLAGLFILPFAITHSSPVAAQETQDAVITRSDSPDAAVVELTRLPLRTPEGNAYEAWRPLFITHAGDGSGRLFLVEQGGKILVIDPETNVASVFLDVSELVTWDANTQAYTERGLLGLAFHPDYADNGRFYINYTDRQGATKIARYRVSDDANVANADSAEILFTMPQPFANHNGGHMAFGPDGYLYVSLGDGGAANDPLAAGQNPRTLLGTILRLDINTDAGYAIPPDNPFVGSDAGADEVWAYGLRNVWRFSFDRATDDLYLGDVGQNQWEEINFEPADSPGGVNYGWNGYEGTHVFNQRAVADNAVMPIAEYNHSQGCSVTGGYVYRGEAIPELEGLYFYGDYCSGNIWVAYRDEAMNWQSTLFTDTPHQISSFGQDEAGELYVINYGGQVYKMTPAQ